MLRISARSLHVALAFAAALCVADATVQQAQAYCPQCNSLQCRQRHYGTPDLFANYYEYGQCGGVAAGMYPAPSNLIPPFVGHTYYTYEPLMPHELLYQHHRTYYRYYDAGRGLTRTSVKWR